MLAPVVLRVAGWEGYSKESEEDHEALEGEGVVVEGSEGSTESCGDNGDCPG